MTDTALDYQAVAQRNPVDYRPALHRLAGWSVIVFVALAALVAGLILRRYAWDQTEPIRYVMDIDNAFYQGTQTLQIGYIERYDEQITRPNQNAMMALDYAPGRLAIATLWTRWVWAQLGEPMPKIQDDNRSWYRYFYTHARSLNEQYELCKPMLMVNVAGEILSAIAMFFLARRYTMGKPPNHRPVRGAVLGMVAALFFWFNPALIWNAHCWPQWDSWVLPFFLWAVLLASLDWWFCAGLVMAAGAMFKAQILFGAPLFVLWPLFQGRLLAIVRWIIGLLFGAAAITSVWLVHAPNKDSREFHYLPGALNPVAVTWLIYLAAIFVAMVPVIIWPRKWAARIPASMAAAATVGWIISAHVGNTYSVIGFLVLALGAAVINFRSERWPLWARIVAGGVASAVLVYPAFVLIPSPLFQVHIVTAGVELGALALVGLLIWLAPRRIIPFAFTAWMATALWLCVFIFHGSTAWFDRGIALGTHHYERMTSGDNNNLAELLETKWGWDDLMEPVFTLPEGKASDHVAEFLDSVDPGVHIQPGDPVGLPLKYFLTGVWVLSVVLCAIGTAVHDRRRSPRFLASIAAPWIMFFAVMTQMHQRYLLWGASLSAATAVLSPGYALLHLFLSVVSASQEMMSMMSMMNNHLDPGNPLNLADNAAFKFFLHWHPGVSWAVIFTASVFVYTAVKWDKRESPKSESEKSE